MYFAYQYLYCCIVYYYVNTGPEIICNVCISIIYIHIICLDLCGFVLQLGPLNASVACKSNSCFNVGPPLLHMLCSVCLTVWYLASLAVLGPCPGTTKNLHLASLCLNLPYIHQIVHYLTDCMFLI